MTRRVALDRSKLVAVLRDLEMIVLSLDRIGSSEQDMSEVEFWEASSRFLRDWSVARRLLTARMMLSEPFSDELGPDDMDELERLVHDVPHWTFNERQPPTDWERPEAPDQVGTE